MKIDKQLKCVVIGDLHLGINDTKRLVKEADELIIPYIEDHHEEIDVLIGAGDWFDSEIKGEKLRLSLIFLSKLFELLDRYNIKFRYVQGTNSHDLNQPLTFFTAFANTLPNLDIKIITTVSEEIIDGKKILYVPEEYVDDYTIYYEKYMNSEYDLITGHGAFIYALSVAAVKINSSNQKVAPIMDEKLWLPALKHGVAIFGHIHNGKDYKGKIFYTRPITCWRYDDKLPRGFMVVTFKEKQGDITIDYIENKNAPEFKEVKLNTITNGERLEIKELIKKIKETIEPNVYRQIDVKELNGTEILTLIKHFKDNKQVKFLINNEDTYLVEDFGKESEELKQDYDYIFRAKELGLTIEEVIARFCGEQIQVMVIPDRVREIIAEVEK